jgi:hypothetical protein
MSHCCDEPVRGLTRATSEGYYRAIPPREEGCQSWIDTPQLDQIWARYGQYWI